MLIINSETQGPRAIKLAESHSRSSSASSMSRTPALTISTADSEAKAMNFDLEGPYYMSPAPSIFDQSSHIDESAFSGQSHLASPGQMADLSDRKYETSLLTLHVPDPTHSPALSSYSGSPLWSSGSTWSTPSLRSESVQSGGNCRDRSVSVSTNHERSAQRPIEWFPLFGNPTLQVNGQEVEYFEGTRLSPPPNSSQSPVVAKLSSENHLGLAAPPSSKLQAAGRSCVTNSSIDSNYGITDYRGIKNAKRNRCLVISKDRCEGCSSGSLVSSQVSAFCTTLLFRY
jgi:hypothetical protein